MDIEDDKLAHTRSNGSFPKTQWSIVLAAGNSGSDDRKALADLCEIYWFPIFSFLRRSYSEADAKDLTQGFFEGVIRRDDFGKLTAEKGKFRTFLLSALKNYQANRWNHDHTQSRGGEHDIISIDYIVAEKLYNLEPSDSTTPESLFEVRFAYTLFERVISRLKEFYRGRRKDDLLQELLPFLAPNARTHSYEEAALNLGCSEGAARKAVYDIRLKFKECFRAEVFETVKMPQDVDEEITHLINTLGSNWPFSEGGPMSL